MISTINRHIQNCEPLPLKVQYWLFDQRKKLKLNKDQQQKAELINSINDKIPNTFKRRFIKPEIFDKNFKQLEILKEENKLTRLPRTELFYIEKLKDKQEYAKDLYKFVKFFIRSYKILGDKTPTYQQKKMKLLDNTIDKTIYRKKKKKEKDVALSPPQNIDNNNNDILMSSQCNNNNNNVDVESSHNVSNNSNVERVLDINNNNINDYNNNNDKDIENIVEDCNNNNNNSQDDDDNNDILLPSQFNNNNVIEDKNKESNNNVINNYSKNSDDDDDVVNINKFIDNTENRDNDNNDDDANMTSAAKTMLSIRDKNDDISEYLINYVENKYVEIIDDKVVCVQYKVHKCFCNCGPAKSHYNIEDDENGIMILQHGIQAKYYKHKIYNKQLPTNEIEEQLSNKLFPESNRLQLHDNNNNKIKYKISCAECLLYDDNYKNGFIAILIANSDEIKNKIIEDAVKLFNNNNNQHNDHAVALCFLPVLYLHNYVCNQYYQHNNQYYQHNIQHFNNIIQCCNKRIKFYNKNKNNKEENNFKLGHHLNEYIKNIPCHYVHYDILVIIQNHRNHPNKYYLDITGGKRHLNEKSVDCANRETKEESSINIDSYLNNEQDKILYEQSCLIIKCNKYYTHTNIKNNT